MTRRTELNAQESIEFHRRPVGDPAFPAAHPSDGFFGVAECLAQDGWFQAGLRGEILEFLGGHACPFQGTEGT